MKKTLVLGCALLASLALMFTSCASGSDGSKGEKKGKAAKITDADYLTYLNDGDYVSCINYLTEKNAKNEKKNKTYIRDYYDIAMMNHLSGDYESAINTMNEVDQLMKDALTVSITKSAGAALFNDNIADYAGRPYEYIYANIFNALNYYNSGDVDEAAVEIRKLNDKQKEFLVKYGELLQNYDPDADVNEDAADESADGEAPAEESKPKMTAAEAMKMIGLPADQVDSFKTSKPAKAAAEDTFRDSAAARYISMLFYMMDKDVDSAKLDAATIKALGSDFNTADDLSIPADQGRIDVLAFSGLIGRRGEMRKIFGPFQGLAMTVQGIEITIPPFDLEYPFPVYPAPQEYNYKELDIDVGLKKPIVIGPGNTTILPAAPASIDTIKLVMDDGTEVAFNTVENFGDAVMHDVNTRARNAYNRSMARSITSKVSTIIASSAALVAAQKAGLPAGNPVYDAAVIGLAKAIDQVDKGLNADVRQVYALPGTMSSAGVNVPAGTYSFKVQFISNGEVVEEKAYTDVAVTAGVPTLVEALCTK